MHIGAHVAIHVLVVTLVVLAFSETKSWGGLLAFALIGGAVFVALVSPTIMGWVRDGVTGLHAACSVWDLFVLCACNTISRNPSR